MLFRSEKAVKPNIFMRLGLFIKQIIDELRKVVTPTSKELFFWALAVFMLLLKMQRNHWVQLTRAFRPVLLVITMPFPSTATTIGSPYPNHRESCETGCARRIEQTCRQP